MNTTLGATLDWENEVIPEEEDDKCRKIIMAMIDRAKEMQQKYPEFDYDFATRIDFTSSTYGGEVSEENICKALKAFKNLNGGRHEDIVLRRGERWFEGIVIKNSKWHSTPYKTTIHIGDGVGWIHITVDIYLDDELESKDFDSYRKSVKKYQELCTYIFGEEYYSSDSKFG